MVRRVPLLRLFGGGDVIREPSTRRLYRSREHRLFAGVAGGIADYLGVDPTVVRALWVIGGLLMAPMTAPVALLVYLVLAAALPEEPREE